MANFKFISLSIDTYFDKVFYINLKKDVERNEHMIQQFRALGINNFERVEAIELVEIPGYHKYRNFIKTEHRYILGSLSCRESHLLCINKARERNYSKVLILEDDVVFLQNPHELLAQNYHSLERWDMLYFGGLVEPHFRNQIVGTYAYAVKQTLFDNIIFMANSSGMEMDNFYAKIIQHMSCNYNLSGKYDIKMIFPFNQITYSTAFMSNIR